MTGIEIKKDKTCSLVEAEKFVRKILNSLKYSPETVDETYDYFGELRRMLNVYQKQYLENFKFENRTEKFEKSIMLKFEINSSCNQEECKELIGNVLNSLEIKGESKENLAYFFTSLEETIFDYQFGYLQNLHYKDLEDDEEYIEL